MTHLRSQAQGTASLDHSRSRGAIKARQPEAIELGNEPPLSVDGGTSGFVDRRRVSVQWFAGTILTALCGAALMGGAVFTSLDGQANFAALPERVEVALRGALGAAGDKLGVSRKSDRLPTAEEPSYMRQIIRVSTTTRAGNHEIVRVRPFVRIAGNLSLTVSDLSANIPAFNPQRMLAESAPGDTTADAPPEAQPDAEVAFVMRDLGPMLPKLKIALLTPPDEVMARVHEAADWNSKSASRGPIAPDVTGIKLAYAGVANPDPYAGFEARIVPENITLLAKTTDQTTGGNPMGDKVILAKKGDTVAALIKDLGGTPEELAEITQSLGPYGRPNVLKDGQKLRVMLTPVPDSKRLQPVRVIVADESSVLAAAGLADTGKYVQVDVKNVDTEVAEAQEDSNSNNSDSGGVTLYQSVYETALRDQVPRPIIDDLIRMYSYDVDFQRNVQPGDSFEVMYAGEDEQQPSVDSHNDVLFATLTVAGESKKLYRFQSPDDGIVDYYDEDGKSAKKFLVRKPVAEAVMRSGFGLRRHPILGYTKMHTGVDWAGPMGTPVYAAGNGVIEKEGWESGYGKFILIRHNNGYETAYGHMSGYARGVDEGTHVRQGQVIGFMGSTGLSTGSHLHFEIRVNGRFVDPMRIKLPRGRELQGPMLATFEQERARLDSIMSRKPARVATR